MSANAKLVLAGPRVGSQMVTTDGFGDFWFQGLAEGGMYQLAIAADSFASQIFARISAEKDVNLGDILLARWWGPMSSVLQRPMSPTRARRSYYTQDDP